MHNKYNTFLQKMQGVFKNFYIKLQKICIYRWTPQLSIFNFQLKKHSLYFYSECFCFNLIVHYALCINYAFFDLRTSTNAAPTRAATAATLATLSPVTGEVVLPSPAGLSSFTSLAITSDSAVTSFLPSASE